MLTASDSAKPGAAGGGGHQPECPPASPDLGRCSVGGPASPLLLPLRDEGDLPGRTLPAELVTPAGSRGRLPGSREAQGLLGMSLPSAARALSHGASIFPEHALCPCPCPQQVAVPALSWSQLQAPRARLSPCSPTRPGAGPGQAGAEVNPGFPGRDPLPVKGTRAPLGKSVFRVGRRSLSLRPALPGIPPLLQKLRGLDPSFSVVLGIEPGVLYH